MFGLTAIGTPWDAIIGGMKDTGRVRFIPAHVGLHRAMNGIAIGMVTGKAIVGGANMTITGTGTTTAIIANTTGASVIRLHSNASEPEHR